MMKIDRISYVTHPDVQKLVNANLTWNPENGKFKWKVTIGGEEFEINKAIKPILLEMTKNHCAFCDYLISSDFFHPSIEHFEPKSKCPEKAYLWENLFPSCNGCTEKKDDKFDIKLLKPDEDSYSFGVYFTVTGDGKIEPALTADGITRERAEVTIEIYKLNKRGTLLKERKKHFEDYQKLGPIINEDDRNFRFLISFAEQARKSSGPELTSHPDTIINEFIQ